MKRIYVSGPIISNDEKWIYDWLEKDATCPRDVAAQLPQSSEPIEIFINSGGGYVDCGNEIYTELKSYTGEVTTVVISAASAASVIALGGNVVKMTPPGELMIHNASMVAVGDYHSMEKGAEILKMTNKAIASVYRRKTGLTEEELLALMDKETWMTAEDALKYGFIDEILFQDEEAEIKLVASNESMISQKIISKMQELKQSNPEEIFQKNNQKNKKQANPFSRFLF